MQNAELMSFLFDPNLLFFERGMGKTFFSHEKKVFPMEAPIFLTRYKF